MSLDCTALLTLMVTVFNLIRIHFPNLATALNTRVSCEPNLGLLCDTTATRACGSGVLLIPAARLCCIVRLSKRLRDNTKRSNFTPRGQLPLITNVGHARCILLPIHGKVLALLKSNYHQYQSTLSLCSPADGPDYRT